jgi:hypothetical protein
MVGSYVGFVLLLRIVLSCASQYHFFNLRGKQGKFPYLQVPS